MNEKLELMKKLEEQLVTTWGTGHRYKTMREVRKHNNNVLLQYNNAVARLKKKNAQSA